ncbi:hypothetical protein AVEN_24634-1, partial [Araneus ventricosus]
AVSVRRGYLIPALRPLVQAAFLILSTGPITYLLISVARFDPACGVAALPLPDLRRLRTLRAGSLVNSLKKLMDLSVVPVRSWWLRLRPYFL